LQSFAEISSQKERLNCPNAEEKENVRKKQQKLLKALIQKQNLPKSSFKCQFRINKTPFSYNSLV